MCALCICKPQTGSHKSACILVHQLQEVVFLVAASDQASFPFLHQLQWNREIDPWSMFFPLWFRKMRISLIKKGQCLTGASVSDRLSEWALTVWNSQALPLKHCDFSSSLCMPKCYAEKGDSAVLQLYYIRWQGFLCGSFPEKACHHHSGWVCPIWWDSD